MQVNSAAFEVGGDYSDHVLIWQRFIELVNHLSGVTVIGSLKHEFPGGGFSGLILLGESHAAIHTFPERNAAWVELATCGDVRALDEFRVGTQRLADMGLTPELQA